MDGTSSGDESKDPVQEFRKPKNKIFLKYCHLVLNVEETWTLGVYLSIYEEELNHDESFFRAIYLSANMLLWNIQILIFPEQKWIKVLRIQN